MLAVLGNGLGDVLLEARRKRPLPIFVLSVSRLDAMEKIQRYASGASLETFERDEALIDGSFTI